MKMMKCCFAAFFAFLLLMVSASAEAAGNVQDIDFTCKGISLGMREADIKDAFGKELFSEERMVMGIYMRYMTYDKGYTIGVAVRTGKVLDIVIKDKDYVARDGVKYGATAWKIEQTYGKANRTFIDGGKAYIYRHPEHKRRKLLLMIDTMDNYLLSWRITELPLDGKEADEMETTDDWDNPGLENRMLGELEIDISALPKDDGEVKLRIGG